MSVSIHIERLILDGLPIAQRDRPRLQAAVEAELARLLCEGALAADLRSAGMLAHADGGTIELSGNEEPELLGKRIAQAVCRGIGA